MNDFFRIMICNLILDDIEYPIKDVHDDYYESLRCLGLKDRFEIKGLGQLGIRTIRSIPISHIGYHRTLEIHCYKIDTTLPY